MAGAGTLDVPAMADLAEARWRSGDLEGAAEAARAHQASGGAEPMAALILAEDLMRAGQAADARRYAEYVLARTGGATDQLFAQEPRGAVWPEADDGWMAHGRDRARTLGPAGGRQRGRGADAPVLACRSRSRPSRTTPPRGPLTS